LSRIAILIAVGAGGAIAAQAAPAGALPVYRSPGYRGLKKIPARTPLPPHPFDIATGMVGKPGIYVDASGTADVVWNESVPDSPDVMHFCQVPRAERACINPQSFVPAQDYSFGGNAPGFNTESGGPRIFAIGNELVILTHRYPNVVMKPDKSLSGDATYIWTSVDQGRSFTGPGLVGDNRPSGDAIGFGTSTPSIATISDTQTGGTFFQASPAGGYTGEQANLGDGGPDRAYSGTLALLDPSTPVAAFADLTDTSYVRQYSGSGDPNSSASWTAAAAIPNSVEPRLTGGPRGVYLATMSTAGPTKDSYVVSHYAGGGSFSAPVPASVPGAIRRDLFEDPGGALHLAWFDRNASTPVVQERSSLDGTHWGPAVTVAQPGAADVNDIHVGATADGGGFAIWTSTANGMSAITMSPHGSQAQLPGEPPPPAPGSPGSDPSETLSCQQVTFGAVRAVTEAGCFLRAPNNPTGSAGVTSGTVRINGLEIIPDANVQIVIDPKAHTIDALGGSATVTVLLHGGGVPDITLWHGGLHAKLPLAGQEQTLFNFKTSDFLPSVEGFPLEGTVDVILGKDSVRIPISMKLPAVFGGISGNAELVADNTTGLHLSTLNFDVNEAFIGPIELQKLHVDYTAADDAWNGEVAVGIPPRPAGPALDAKIGFQMGRFDHADATLTFPAPGIALGPGVFLTVINAGFRLEPLQIKGGATISALPIGGASAVSVDGELQADFPSAPKPSSFSMTGNVAIVGVGLAEGHVLFQTDGYFEAGGGYNLDLSLVSLSGALTAFVDGSAGTFAGEVNADVCIAALGCVGGDAVISTKGIGACVHLFVDAGFTYPWGGGIGDVDVMFPSCDLSAVRIPPRARTAQAGTLSVSVPGGVPSEELILGTDRGAAGIVLTSPAGQHIVPSADLKSASAAYAITDPKTKRTFVGLIKPAAGNWTVATADGSPIGAVSQADGLAPPVVKASVGGRARARVLRYSATMRPNLVTTFAEQGANGLHVIGTARVARGRLPFTPANGPAGKRTIIAIVTENGLPRERVAVATYSAPGPLRPARVGGLRLSRSGRALTISWKAAANATRYAILIVGGDGRHDLRVVSAGTHRLRVAVVAHTRVQVTVAGLRPDGSRGPAGAARLKA
jgi:hypothetical protein